MSNELAMMDMGLPDYLKGLTVDDATKALMGGGTGGIKRISIRGSVWRMMVNGKEVAKNEERAMNVVIVAAADKKGRKFYAKQWSEDDEPTAPDCWSADGEFPDAKAANPQAKRCMDCSMNEKGSGQGTSRACRYSQQIAVVLANDLKGDVYALTLPAQSVFGEGSPGKWPLQTYGRVIGSKGIPVTAVVTEMRFDTDSSTPKLTFKGVKYLTAEEHQIAIDQGKTEAAIKAITMTVAEIDHAKQPKQISAPVESTDVVVEAAPVAEPVKRTTKKEEAAAPKADLSKILEEWDD